jgi:murein L,D-transpeptidase YafK
MKARSIITLLLVGAVAILLLWMATGRTVAFNVADRKSGADRTRALNAARRTIENAGEALDAEAIALNRTPLKLPLDNPRIVVEKSRRRLKLYSGGSVVRTWRIGLGTKPRGDKLRQGDRRTPEGTFYICQKNPNSQYYLSLGLSYPTPDDARRALRSKLITQAQHDAIVEAHKARTCPPWNTALGGEVFVHGHGSKRDWTWGCVALDDGPMKELYSVVPTGTAITIKP